MSKKRILTGHVSRIINGIPVVLGPGDPAPDWVTNPALIATAEKSAPSADTVPEATKTEETKAVDELDALKITQLREVAEQAGVAKSGSKQELIDRIRAKRAADSDSGANSAEAEAAGGDRDEMLAKAAELGIEDADQFTDDELQAALESQE